MRGRPFQIGAIHPFRVPGRTDMTGKASSKLVLLCRALILPCIVSIVLLSQTDVERRNAGQRNDSIGCVKQVIWDLSLLPNKSLRFRNIPSTRNAGLEHGLAQSPYLFTLPFSCTLIPFNVELLNPQSLAVFNPNTRSPPF